MPLCGFNDKMLKGLTNFSEGLVEHGLVYRGGLNEETLDQGIRRELSDMARLRPELGRIEDAAKRTITRGIVDYATGFYMVMRQKDLMNNPAKYKEFIGQMNQYFWAMDNQYYTKLEGNPFDMQELASYLNTKEI